MHSAMFYVRGQYRDEILAVTVLRCAVGSLIGKLTSLDVHLRLDPVVDTDGAVGGGARWGAAEGGDRERRREDDQPRGGAQAR